MEMNALRVEKGARAPSLRKVTVPDLEPTDVLIKVECAILAPDVLRLVEAGVLTQAPTTLGHKVAGTIERIGDDVTNIEVGQRVRLEPNLNCGACKYCRTDRDQMCAASGIMGFFSLQTFPKWEQYHQGGLAEYVRAPASQVDILPPNISMEDGAKVHDLANAVGVYKHSAPPVGSTILVAAATGAMGVSIVRLASFFGVGRLILVGRSTKRLEQVAALTNVPSDIVGLDTLDEDWVSSRGLGKRIQQLAPEGVDAIIDYSPEGQDMWQTLDGLAVGGCFLGLGGNRSLLPFSTRDFGARCWRVIGIRNHTREDTRLVLQLLKSGQLKVDMLTTHKFKLQDVEAALGHLRGRKEASWMIAIQP